MILAICAKGEGLSSQVEDRFGRTPYFVCIDLTKDEIVSLKNPGAQAMGGAGPKTVQFLADHRVGGVVAGKVGPKAWRALEEAGIAVYKMEGEQVKDSLDKYRRDLLMRYSSLDDL